MFPDFVFNHDDANRFAQASGVTQKLDTILRQIGQRLCGLRGHNTLVHFEPNRMSLQCSRCGFQSSGWHIGKSSALRDHRALPPAKANTGLVPVRGRLAWGKTIRKGEFRWS